MSYKIKFRNAELKEAMAEFFKDQSDDTFIGIIIALAQTLQQQAVLPVAVDGDVFRTIHDDEDGDFLSVFTDMDEAEMGPETELVLMTIEDLAGNIFDTEGLEGFIINAFSDPVFVDRQALRAAVETAYSSPLKEVTIDVEGMDPGELVDLAYEIEKGEEHFLADPMLAAAIYKNVIDDDFDLAPDDPDPDELREFRAAQAQAMNNLGVLHLTGNGVDLDTGEAEELFMRARDELNTSAIFNLGALAEAEEDYEKAAALYEEAAILGDSKALAAYGKLHIKGEGVPQDIEKAYGYLQKAADDSEDMAYYYLGLIEEKGYRGIPDIEKAIYYYTAGADLDNVRCMDKVSDLAGEMADFEIENDINDEDEEEDTFVFDLSEKPGGLRS
ncbi:MAG: SEL1-like repeat protein [Firmicutes bacterium]|nr:SEL1-like repeat protein [Bacillota bacterium]